MREELGMFQHRRKGGNRMEMQQIRRQVEETDIAWLAGIIDGEGYLTLLQCGLRGKLKLIKKPTKTIHVLIGVNNTHPLMLVKLTNIYYDLGLSFHSVLRTPKNKKHKPSIAVVVTGNRNCKKLLEKIFPYLSNKKNQASVMLSYLEYREGRKRIIGCVRDLYYIPNHKQQAILKFFEEMKKAKIVPDASETTRRASQPIEMKI